MMSQVLKPLEITENDKKRADEYKAEANALFATQDYEHAVEKYSEAISHDPTNPVYFSNRSICNFRLELYGQALIDATTAIELDPKFAKAYYRKASAHMALGQLKESIQDFKEVLKVQNDQATRQKLIQCQKEYKRIEFEKAIYSENKTLTAIEQLGDVEAIDVESAYEGPHLLTNEITLEFVKDLLDHMKNQKKLHRKYTYKLLLMAKEYFESRPTIEDIVIPEGAKITVCGDIHGQFYDLLNVFEINGLPSLENMYLWNGDFVDRGSFSVECILTLFCFKLLYPNSVFLSRGNHETDDMNRVYGFEGEVKAKYSQALFKLFSEIFNAIPLGNLIMNKILVIHGGLFSRDNVSIQELRDIDRFKQPGSNGLMSELLWADPQFLPGRAPSKRGVGLQFGPDVTKNFLEFNDLKMVIRSHEVKHEGYEIQHNGQLVTIFSAPNYCDTTSNKGAYIHITRDLDLSYHQFSAVPHPPIRAMQYANMYGLF